MKKLLVLTVALAALACTPPPPAPPEPPEPPTPVDPDDFNACVPLADGPDFQISSKGQLRWKRARALERDLTGALSLTEQEICSELGIEAICFDFIHLVPLGGKSAILDGMYTANPSPSLTTPISLDRVILSACGRRVDVDDFFQRNNQAPVVFTNYTLNTAAPNDADATAQVTDLYRAFLARNPTADELTEILSLRDDADARDFSKLACYAIASTTEFLFQ